MLILNETLNNSPVWNDKMHGHRSVFCSDVSAERRHLPVPSTTVEKTLLRNASVLFLMILLGFCPKIT